MQLNFVGTNKCNSLKIFYIATALLLAASPMRGTAATNSAKTVSKAMPTAACKVQAVNYLGWKAEELSNQWVKLEVVPQIGGRLLQVSFGGHDMLYLNPLLQGQVIPLGTRGSGGRNYGGDKIWPMPEGNQDEQHWGQGGSLDSEPFTLKVLSRGAKCAVRLTGPIEPDIGQRYIRDISIEPDSPVISFHNVMKNETGYPQTWSEQTITEYPMSIPSGTNNFNTKFWGITPANPASVFPKGYFIETGPQESQADSVSDGNFKVHWNNVQQEVWIDSTQGWLAAVDGTGEYTMVERRHYDPTATYPGKTTIIFYSTGDRVRRQRPAGQRPAGAPPLAGATPQATTPLSTTPVTGQVQNAAQREGPFMEAEINSPMVELGPGESYAMDTQWFPTRMGEDFKTATYSGVVGTPLAATETPNGIELTGSFGVFYAGDLVAHFYGRGGDGTTAKLIAVTPTDAVQLKVTVQVPPRTSRVSIHLVDAKGIDHGPLGEVLLNSAMQRTP